MIDSSLNLPDVLLSLESSLMISHKADTKMVETIDSAIKALEGRCKTSLDDGFEEAMNANLLCKDDMVFIFRNLSASLANLALYVTMKVYHKNIPFRLDENNCFGYSKPKLMTELAYLLDEKMSVTNRSKFMASLTQQLDTVAISYAKRLCTVMLVLDKLDLSEGVSIVALCLYIGGAS